MPANEDLTNKIREALFSKGLADVEEKKMFNGICFMVNGKMCVCASITKCFAGLARIIWKL